jgi:hypothetical protein
MARLLYDPREFLQFKGRSGKLESFLVIKIQNLLGHVLDDVWRPLIEKIALQIRCVSDGWDLPPRLTFELVIKDDCYVSRLLLIQE